MSRFISRLSRYVAMTTTACLLLGVLTATSTAKRVEIEHFVAPAWGQVAFEAYQRIAAQFNEQQNEIQVNVVMGVGNYEEAVMTRIVGGAAPDVISTNKYADLAPKGVLQPLTEFAKRDNFVKTLLPPAVEQSTWEGELLMLPQVAQPFVTYYNPSLFAQAGIPDPYSLHKSGSWTWDAVSSSARKISADSDGDGKLDIWGMGIPVNWQQRTVLWVLQAGGKYFDRWVNPNKATYDSPEVGLALSFLYDQIQKQAMPYEGAIGSTGNKNLIAGKAGMVFEGTWQIGNNRNGKFFDWDVAPVAKGPANAGTIMQVDGLQMLKATPHPEEAWKWMKYLVSNQEAYSIFTQATGRSPAVLRGLQTYLKVVVEDGKPTHVEALADAMMNPIVGPCIPIVGNISAVGNVFGTEVTKYLKSEQSLQATLAKINDTANLTIQQLKNTAK